MRAVKEAADKAVAHCRAGHGPYILEMMTYRYRGHSMSDPGKYRTRDEIQKMRDERDAIEQVRRRLLEGVLSEDELKKIMDETGNCRDLTLWVRIAVQSKNSKLPLDKKFGVSPQNLRGDGVEGAQPAQPLGFRADDR